MSNTEIDSKSESHKYGTWIASAKINTTLTLLDLGNGKVGIKYESVYSGIKNGQMKGGPLEIHKNVDKVFNMSPEVKIVISQFSKESDYVTMNVCIVVSVPVIGEHTIYNQTLSGKFDNSSM